MRIRKPLTETICPACTHRFSANDNEVADIVRCPRCGHERRIDYPPAFEEKLGCGWLVVAAVVLFLLAKATGGGGIFGILLGVVLGLGIPAAIAAVAYHVMRASDE